MSNMSYCRFQNTARDLEDCRFALHDTSDLSVNEERARLYLIRLAIQIVEEIDDYEEEEKEAKERMKEQADY